MSREAQYQLIAAEPSFFSAKARGYLRHKKIPYREVMPSVAVYLKTIIPRVGKAIIPVLITPEDECIQDTTLIIDYLEKRFSDYPVHPRLPSAP